MPTTSRAARAKVRAPQTDAQMLAVTAEGLWDLLSKAVSGDTSLRLFPNGVEKVALKVVIGQASLEFEAAGPNPSAANHELPARSTSMPFAAGFTQAPQDDTHGYYRYSPGTNQYGTPPTIQTLIDVGGSWHLNEPGSPFGLGDISLAGGGEMPGHTTGHRLGRNIDVRPFRSDGRREPVSIHDAAYDRAKTSLIIQAFLAHANVSFVIFNDPQIPGVRLDPSGVHDNHFHVQTTA